MAVMTAKTVREVAVENPAATRVFERFGIDYCCGGNQGLEQACQMAGVSFDEVVDSLEMDEEAARASKPVHDWRSEPLSELITHIKKRFTSTPAKKRYAWQLYFRECARCMERTIRNCTESVRRSAGCLRS